jgi:hypothetical protein
VVFYHKYTHIFYYLSPCITTNTAEEEVEDVPVEEAELSARQEK